MVFVGLALVVGCSQIPSAPDPNASLDSSPDPTPDVSSAPSPSASSEVPPTAPPKSNVDLEVRRSGTGVGVVVGNGISCGSACKVNLPVGTTVNLTATGSPGSVFSSWSGPCSGSGACTFIISSSTVATALFTSQDVQAPTTPGGLSAVASSSSSVRLSWSAATDNIGVVSYQVFRNASPAPIVTTSSLTFTDSGLNPSSTYLYTVSAVDAAGNSSPKSPAASVTTPAATATYSLGGQILGMSAGDVLVLRANNNAGTLSNTLTLSNSVVSYQMPERFAAGTSYALQIVSSPAQKLCTASNASGIVSANIANVDIVCVRQEGNCVKASTNLWSILIRNPAEVDDYYDGINSLVCYGDNLYVGGHFRQIAAQQTGPVAQVLTTGSGAATSESYISLDTTIVEKVIADGQGGWFARTSKVVPAVGYPPWIYVPKTFHILQNRSVDPNWTHILDLGPITYHKDYLYAVNSSSRLIKISVSSGEQDPRFSVSLPATTLTLAVHGSYLYLGGTYGLRRVKMNVDGTATLDAVWQNDLGNMMVFVLAVDSNGVVYAGGSGLRRVLTQVNGTAVVDAVWNPNLRSSVNAITIAADGSLYVGGSITLAGGLTRSNLVKMWTNGSGAVVVDPWYPVVNGMVNSIALDADQNIFVGGDFTAINGEARNRVAKFSSSGVLQSWNPNAESTVQSLAISGNRVLMGGKFKTIGGIHSVTNLAKFSLTTGALDPNWNPVPNGVNYHDGVVFKLALSSDGQDLYVQSMPLPRGNFNIAKISTAGSGTVDSRWRSNITTLADSMTNQDSNLMYSTYNGTDARITRMDRDGNVLTDLRVEDSLNWTINTRFAAAWTVYGSDLYYVPPGSPLVIRRMNLNTQIVDANWQISIGKLPTIMRAYGGYLYVSFVSGPASDVRHFLRKYSLTQTGTVSPVWENDLFGGGFSGWRPLYDLRAAGDSLYLGGRFSSLNGQTRLGLARLSIQSGSLVSDWAKNVSGPASSYTYSILPVPDDSMIYTGEDNGLGVFSVP